MARKTQKTIRNTRGVTISMRLEGKDPKPFRVHLQPRGRRGDWVTVPAACTDDPQFTSMVHNGLVEIIPLTEARRIEYDYVGRPTPTGAEVTAAGVEHVAARSETVAYINENMTEISRNPITAKQQAKVDAETAKLQESGVMPPLPEVK